MHHISRPHYAGETKQRIYQRSFSLEQGHYIIVMLLKALVFRVCTLQFLRFEERFRNDQFL